MPDSKISIPASVSVTEYPLSIPINNAALFAALQKAYSFARGFRLVTVSDLVNGAQIIVVTYYYVLSGGVGYLKFAFEDLTFRSAPSPVTTSRPSDQGGRQVVACPSCAVRGTGASIGSATPPPERTYSPAEMIAPDTLVAIGDLSSQGSRNPVLFLVSK